MSSSRRYQSKLLNFLSRQSLRIQDKSGETWRHAKIAAVWGIQILLYPIYVGFQATRLVGKQLRQVARQVLPQLQAAKQTMQQATDKDSSDVSQLALTSDVPIQNTLQAVEALALSFPASRLALQLDPKNTQAPGVLVIVGDSRPPKNAMPEPKRVEIKIIGHGEAKQLSLPATSAVLPAFAASGKQSSMQVQGIASLVATRKLVLVTVENQVLDVLTSEQRSQLQRRIVWEIATYWRSRRVLGTQRRSLRQSIAVNNFLPLPKERPNALPPIRIFRGLMAWMQTGPVAIATNLFQESRLALYLPTNEETMALPGFELPLRSAQTSWQTIEELFKNASKDWFDRSSPSSVLRWLDELLPQSTAQIGAAPATSVSKTDSAPLGDRSSCNPSSQPPQFWGSRLIAWLLQEPRQMDNAADELQTEPAPDANPKPWLTLEDLFGHSRRTIASSLAASQSAASQSAIAPTKPTSADWELQDTAALEIAQTRENLSKLPDLSNPEIEQQTRLKTEQAAIAPEQFSEQSKPTLATPSAWIETEAKLVTYEKHPLEQLLGWLDRGMAWIEKTLAQIWQWLSDRSKN